MAVTMKEINPVSVLEALVAEHGTQEAAANALGIAKSYFSDLMHGRRDFSDAILDKLGLRATVVKK